MTSAQPTGPQRPRWPKRVYGVGTEPDPRFTLANERTLLAWLRTSLALIVTAIGVVALRTVTSQPALTTVIALIACCGGILTALAGFHRWQQVERALRVQEPLPAPTAATVLAVTLLLAIGVTTGFLVLG